MARKRTAGTLSRDPELFRPEPPVSKKSVKASFCGRDQELDFCLRTLTENLDIDGRRSRKADKRPWIIHGESRCGKSHLARRILADLPVKAVRLQLEVPAREQVQALKVMRTIFQQLVGLYYERIGDQRRAEPLDRPGELSALDALIKRTEDFLKDTQSATESAEAAGEVTLEVGGEISGFLGKLLSKFQTKAANKTGRQIVFRSPDAFRLSEICRAIVEALVSRKLASHLIVLVDDVDLLEGFQSPTRNGQFQRSLLAEALCDLHSEPGVDVLLTARSWYAYTTKEFQTLIDLTTKPLSVEDLIQIHDRRVKLYGGGAIGFLSTDAVRRAAEDMGGLPGVFLNYLQTAHTEYQFEGLTGPRDYEWFVTVFRKLFKALRAKCAPAAQALLDSVRGGLLEITVGDSNPFFGTAFDNQFVYQSYYNERCYFAAPIIRRVLQSEIT
jgi:hypothetical protein